MAVLAATTSKHLACRASYNGLKSIQNLTTIRITVVTSRIMLTCAQRATTIEGIRWITPLTARQS